ncbi:MAG: hypothetical protein MHMPM18_000282 [Marteilia pararefringens]
MLHKQRSETRILCQLCNAWYHNNHASKRKHELSETHRNNVQHSVMQMRATAAAEQLRNPTTRESIDWEEKVANDGSIYYRNNLTGAKMRRRPESYITISMAAAKNAGNGSARKSSRAKSGLNLDLKNYGYSYEREKEIVGKSKTQDFERSNDSWKDADNEDEDHNRGVAALQNYSLSLEHNSQFIKDNNIDLQLPEQNKMTDPSKYIRIMKRMRHIEETNVESNQVIPDDQSKDSEGENIVIKKFTKRKGQTRKSTNVE